MSKHPLPPTSETPLIGPETAATLEAGKKKAVALRAEASMAVHRVFDKHDDRKEVLAAGVYGTGFIGHATTTIPVVLGVKVVLPAAPVVFCCLIDGCLMLNGAAKEQLSNDKPAEGTTYCQRRLADTFLTSASCDAYQNTRRGLPVEQGKQVRGCTGSILGAVVNFFRGQIADDATQAQQEIAAPREATMN